MRPNDASAMEGGRSASAVWGAPSRCRWSGPRRPSTWHDADPHRRERRRRALSRKIRTRRTRWSRPSAIRRHIVRKPCRTTASRCPVRLASTRWPGWRRLPRQRRRTRLQGTAALKGAQGGWGRSAATQGQLSSTVADIAAGIPMLEGWPESSAIIGRRRRAIQRTVRAAWSAGTAAAALLRSTPMAKATSG